MNSNLEIGKRIKSRREQLGLTLDDISRQVGVAKSTIQRYETGKIETPKQPVLLSIANVLQVSLDWLMRKTDILSPLSPTLPLPDNILPLPATKPIPLLGTIACGTPILAQENIEEMLEAPENLHADFALRCKGNSMVGARIYDGDIVYIRQQPIVDNGEIAAVLIEEEATLKRVYRYPDKLVLTPENPAYEPLVFTGPELENIRILGKAVAFLSAL